MYALLSFQRKWSHVFVPYWPVADIGILAKLMYVYKVTVQSNSPRSVYLFACFFVIWFFSKLTSIRNTIRVSNKFGPTTRQVWSVSKLFAKFISRWQKSPLTGKEWIWAVGFPTMWYVRPAKPQISLRICAVWSERLLVTWIFYDCLATDQTSFGVS